MDDVLLPVKDVTAFLLLYLYSSVSIVHRPSYFVLITIFTNDAQKT